MSRATCPDRGPFPSKSEPSIGLWRAHDRVEDTARGRSKSRGYLDGGPEGTGWRDPFAFEGRAWLQNLAVPDDLNAVSSLFERYEGDSARGDFDDALAELDAMVAEALGLDDDQLSHILEAFESDMLLRNVSPQWRHYSRSVEN